MICQIIKKKGQNIYRYVYACEITCLKLEFENLRIMADEDHFLQIKPQQSSKRKHAEDDHNVKYESESRKKHFHRQKHRETRHKNEGERSRNHHHHGRKHHRYEYKIGRNYDKNTVVQKQIDSCKYELDVVNGYRNSNYESTNHRQTFETEPEINNLKKNLSEILEADFEDENDSEYYQKEELQDDEKYSSEEQIEESHDDDVESKCLSKRQVTIEEKESDDSDRTDTNPNSPQINEIKDDDDYLSPTINSFDTAGSDKEMEKINKNLPPYYPAIEGCRSLDEFQCLNRIAEGTYGVVYRFKDKRTDDIVALKKLKMEKEKEGFPITSLREINTLLKGQHPNIVTVREIVVGSNMDKIFIVMDYVEHDLKSLIETMRKKNQTFTPGEVKCLLKQLLSAVAHLHDNWILHRDLKTSNLLLSHKGVLKVADFGLAREYGSPLRPYTPIVVTLWYRAPELLLCIKEYSAPIDIWSVGCIFAEFLLMNPFFPGKSEVEQINKIFKCLGTPSEKVWPGYNQLPAVQKMKFNNYPMSNLRKKFQMLSDLGLNFLLNFLTFDPQQRITAEDALKHSYFNEIPLAIDPKMFPTWPAKSEMGHKRAASPKPPSGGGEFKKLGGDEDGFRIGLETDNRERIGAGFSLKF